MPYVAPEVVQRVKQIDLLTYLKTYEPYELVHFSGNTYTTKTHDSLKISNGKWMWWSRGIGGRSALDYLIKVRGYDFIQAVQTIAEQAAIQPPVSIPAEKKTEKKLILPKPYRYQTYAVSYLQNRGIDMEMIQYCLKTGQIYESENYHNVVFVGMDQSGIPRYAALREFPVMRLCEGSVQTLSGRRPGAKKTILSVSRQKKNAAKSICLSLRLTCYLTPQSKNWTRKIGEKRICYPLRACISLPKKSRKARFRQR